MAYTGTGTEEDPYCVSNLTDFIECINKIDSYVKVIADIDAAADPSYTDELAYPLTISCNCVYADEPKVIKGIKVCSASFIKLEKIGAFVKNLFFVDCVHQKSSSYASIDSVTSGSTPFVFDGCKFSMKIIGYSGFFSTSYVKFQKCAANLTYVSIGTTSNFSESNFQECNFIVNDFVWGASSRLLQGEVIKTGLIFRSLKISINASNPSLNVYDKQNRNCYIVFIDLDTPGGTIYAGNSHQTSLFAFQNKPENLTVNSSLTEITPEQLKSKEYLESIGFFP